MPNPDYIIYGDGGARGNPGPAAYGFVVFAEKEYVLVEEGGTLGETTNNVAEYTAAIEGLKALRKKLGKTKAKKVNVEVRMDSELVVKQMNGVYKIRGENMVPLFMGLWNLRVDFGSVSFVHVPREKNAHADRLVNEALDKEENHLGL